MRLSAVAAPLRWPTHSSRVVRLSSACVAACLPIAAIGAQSAAARGALDGIVTDTTLAPLSGASAWLLGTKLEVSTGESGRFRITDIPPGTYIVVVRRLGYAPLPSALSVAPGDTTRASFALLEQQLTLEKVVVSAATATGPLSEFETRRAAGVGQFMTEGGIEKLNMAGTSGLLRTFHSVAVVPNAVLNSRLLPTLKCPMQFFVDGVAISVNNVERDLPTPHEIAGIEVHANTSTVPLQYASLGGGTPGRGGGSCGVILIWTRR